MHPNHDPALERFVHERLRSLPGIKAPATLAPRVLAAIRAQAELPWWQRSWWSWPVACQVGFGAVTVGLLGLLGTGFFQAGDLVQAWFQPIGNSLSSQIAAWQSGTTAQSVQTGLTYLRSQPYFLHALGIAGAAYLACVGLGTWGFKLAWKRV